jgi:hypothetical protein
MKPDSYNKGARGTSIARQILSKHSLIPEPSLSNVRTQKWSGVFPADRSEATKVVNFEL